MEIKQHSLATPRTQYAERPHWWAFKGFATTNEILAHTAAAADARRVCKIHTHGNIDTAHVRVATPQMRSPLPLPPPGRRRETWAGHVENKTRTSARQRNWTPHSKKPQRFQCKLVNVNHIVPRVRRHPGRYGLVPPWISAAGTPPCRSKQVPREMY